MSCIIYRQSECSEVTYFCNICCICWFDKFWNPKLQTHETEQWLPLNTSLTLCYECNSARAASEHSGLWGASKSCYFHLENDLIRVGASPTSFGSGRFNTAVNRMHYESQEWIPAYLYFPLVQLLIAWKGNVQCQSHAWIPSSASLGTRVGGWYLCCLK